MKKFIILSIGFWMLTLGCVNAQTVEQKKICALKWTLQQTFYNKSEGQQMAHLDVTAFKSFDEFKKNELVSKMIKKVTDATDQRRINNIIEAKTSEEISVPNGAKKEYEADIDKIKSVVSEQEEPVEEDVVEESTEETANETEAGVTPVKPQQASEDSAKEEPAVPAEDPEAETEGSNGVSGIGVWGAILIAVIVYIVLSICIAIFKRSRRNNGEADDEPYLTLEQYRSERLRLMERLKAVEIAIDNMKSPSASGNASAKKPQQPDYRQPEQPAPVVAAPVIKTEPVVKSQPAVVTTPDPKLAEQSLFGDSEAPSAEVTPIIPPKEAATTIKPRHTQSIMFFPVPVDGVFANGTEEIEVGKSLYMLRTTDGENATFTILNTPEAIATALISLTQMVKPVCKILNSVPNPLEIVTEGPGTAVREGDTWKMVTKSVVRLL